jgi:hypothetical protein
VTCVECRNRRRRTALPLDGSIPAESVLANNPRPIEIPRVHPRPITTLVCSLEGGTVSRASVQAGVGAGVIKLIPRGEECPQLWR